MSRRTVLVIAVLRAFLPALAGAFKKISTRAARFRVA
jgi:hypothetical protein